jgi:hypothetical protein
MNRALQVSMQAISANQLKTGGVGAIASALEQEREVGVSVRGDLRYVVMKAEEYQRLQDCELEMALLETRTDLAADRCIEESVDDHLARIDVLAEGLS